jgi:hypothetical protein
MSDDPLPTIAKAEPAGLLIDLSEAVFGLPESDPVELAKAEAWVDVLEAENKQLKVKDAERERVILETAKNLLRTIEPSQNELPKEVEADTASRQLVGVNVSSSEASPDKPDDCPCYVTLVQMSAMVNRSARTLEKKKKQKKNPLPEPDVEGGGGKPHEWLWPTARAWLEAEYGRKLPERFPGNRFLDGRADRS